jgi:hypothetical protein
MGGVVQEDLAMRMIRAKALMYLEGLKTGQAPAPELSAVARALLALGVIFEAEANDFMEPKDRRKRHVPEFLKGSVMTEEKRKRGERRK